MGHLGAAEKGFGARLLFLNPLYFSEHDKQEQLLEGRLLRPLSQTPFVNSSTEVAGVCDLVHSVGVTLH